MPVMVGERPVSQACMLIACERSQPNRSSIGVHSSVVMWYLRLTLKLDSGPSLQPVEAAATVTTASSSTLCCGMWMMMYIHCTA